MTIMISNYDDDCNNSDNSNKDNTQLKEITYII